MNTETPITYATRCIIALGATAHDSEAVARWCYDHPPRKELPKCEGARERQLWISRNVFRCLCAVTPESRAHALAESILLAWIQDNIPTIQAMFQRHEQEQEAQLAELRKGEADADYSELEKGTSDAR